MNKNNLFRVIEIYKKGRKKMLKLTNQIMLETYYKIGTLINKSKINEELLLEKFNFTRKNLNNIKILANNLSLKELNQFKGEISLDNIIFVINNIKTHDKKIHLLKLAYKRKLSLCDIKKHITKKSISE